MDPVSKVSQFLTDWDAHSPKSTPIEDNKAVVKAFKAAIGVKSNEHAIEFLLKAKKGAVGNRSLLSKISRLIRVINISSPTRKLDRPGIPAPIETKVAVTASAPLNPSVGRVISFLKTWGLHCTGTEKELLSKAYVLSLTNSKGELAKCLGEVRNMALKTGDTDLDFAVVEFASRIKIILS